VGAAAVMKNIRKSKLSETASFRTLLVSSVSLLATAVSVEANDAGIHTLEEIIVTATRRSESLQDTGVTVSALSESGLANRSVHTIEEASAFIPAVHIAAYQGDSTIFIRGIGTPAIVGGSDSSTATYVDDVYYSRAAAIGPAFFDVERMEVLRGPQGTLYGRNATGGALKIITKGPTEEFEGETRAIYGDYNRVNLSGAISGPISDTVRARLAVQFEDRDGYATLHRPEGSNLKDGQDADDRHDIAVRLKIETDLTENATLLLTGDYYKADDRASVFHFASNGYGDEIEGWFSTREGSQTALYDIYKSQGRESAPASRDIFTDIDYWRKTEISGITAKLNWDIGEYNLDVTANYKDSNPSMQNDLDTSDAYIMAYLREEDHWQKSIEAQLSSSSDHAFSWILGGYYFEEENIITNNIFGDFWEPILTQGLLGLQAAGAIPVFPVDIPQTPLCCDLHLSGEQETEAWAVYLDTTYEINSQLSINIGGRYSHEERDGLQMFELVYLNPVTGGEPIRFAPNEALFPAAVSDSRDNVIADPFGFVVAPVEGPKTFTSFTPKLAIDYQAQEDLLVYASVQKGFKSGGYNIGSNQREPFEPEDIWSYEAGMKTEFSDRSIRLNMAAFYYDYTNLQAQDSIENQTIIRNVGKAEVLGFELEGMAVVNEFFQIDGSITYTDAEFTEGQLTEPLRPAPLTQAPGSVLQDLDGKVLPRAPEWKFNIGAQATVPINNVGDLIFRLNYGWQSKIYYTVFNIESASQDDYGVLNAKIELAADDGRWSVSAFGKNLNDEVYFANMILSGAVYGAEFNGSLGTPRTWGMELKAKF